jgi:hypothetical protein
MKSQSCFRISFISPNQGIKENMKLYMIEESTAAKLSHVTHRELTGEAFATNMTPFSQHLVVFRVSFLI